MSEQTTTRQRLTSARQEQTNSRVRTAFEGAIKRPVKEAVREALAEGVRESPDGSNASDEPVTVEVSGTDDEAGSEPTASDADTESSSETPRSLPRRLLGPRRAVVVLVVVAAAYLRRRRRSDAGAE